MFKSKEGLFGGKRKIQMQRMWQSIMDNSTRSNRRTKGYTKSIEMLKKALDIFFNRHLTRESQKNILWKGVK